MIDEQWYKEYMDRYKYSLFKIDVLPKLLLLRDLCLDVRSRNSKMMVAGNGASAAIASHAAADLTKQAGVRAVTFHDPDLITMLANDFGYEHWLDNAVRLYYQEGDVLILISSSGSSASIVNAAEFANKSGIPVVGFSGFGPGAPLESLSTISISLDSRAYNIIENVHSIWITSVIDMLIGNAEYLVK